MSAAVNGEVGTCFGRNEGTGDIARLFYNFTPYLFGVTPGYLYLLLLYGVNANEGITLRFVGVTDYF